MSAGRAGSPSQGSWGSDYHSVGRLIRPSSDADSSAGGRQQCVTIYQISTDESSLSPSTKRDSVESGDSFGKWNRRLFDSIAVDPYLSGVRERGHDPAHWVSSLTTDNIPVCRASVASSFIDDNDDEDSDTTSCNDEPMSYDDYMNSRRSSQFTDGTFTNKSRQSVDFIDPGLYNSLARK